MNTYLLIFVIALFSSLIFTPLVRRTCERFGWFDEPKDLRRVHRAAIPRLGGVVILFSLLASLFALFFISNTITQSLRAESHLLLVALVPAILVFAIGIVDDMRGLSPRFKLAGQIVAGAIFYSLGGRIETLSTPLLGSIQLPAVISMAITILWIVAITNAFNLIDGIDGLAAGAALFASCVMVTVSIFTGHPFVTVISLALAGALVGFLRYNFYPASIFLGDSGSLLVGFLLATLSVQGIQKASTAVAVAIPVLAFGVPVLDTTLALIRRFLSKHPLFQGDREHIHHKLLARGWSQRRVALVLYGVSALLGLQALLFVQVSYVSQITGMWLFVVGVVVILGVERLHYHEIDEIRAGLRRSLSLADRRLRLANNIRIRRASSAMSKATTLQEFFAAVKEMLELSGFACAIVQLDRNNAIPAKQWLLREREAVAIAESEINEDGILWVWVWGDSEAAEIINSNRSQSLCLSLSTERSQWGHINLYRQIDSNEFLFDVTYLCSFFQTEMAKAAERLLTAEDENAGSLGPRASGNMFNGKHTSTRKTQIASASAMKNSVAEFDAAQGVSAT